MKKKYSLFEILFFFLKFLLILSTIFKQIDKFCQTLRKTIGILQRTRIIFFRRNVNSYVYFEVYCVGYAYTSTALRLDAAGLC